MDITFNTFSEITLDHSWKWINDPEIRKLILSPEISKEMQLTWYKSLRNRKDYMIWEICADSIPVGVVGIKQINVNLGRGEYFGYIGEKEYWGQGIGSCMVEFAEEKAKKAGLNTLFLRVSKDNQRAIRLYEKKGYVFLNELATDINCPIRVYNKRIY